MELTALERKVLEKLLAGDDSTLAHLRTQFQRAEVLSRKFTGVGFFTELRVFPGMDTTPGKKSFRIADVMANIPDMPWGAGFLAYVKDGLLHQIEGYTFGGESWPTETSDFDLQYTSGEKRDMDALRTELL